MDELSEYKSKCCRAAVTFREEIAYGEHKGFHCSKCLEYCEVMVLKPSPNMKGFDTPVVDVQKETPLSHHAYLNTGQLFLKKASDLVKTHMKAVNGAECNTLLQRIAEDILKL